MDQNKEKGFTVKDKRFSAAEEPEKTQNTAAAGSTDSADEQRQSEKDFPPLPEITFSSFIISLSSSALFHFGEIPDPITDKKTRNLPLAKQTIDILGILQAKTAGNLSREESQLIENLLYDLRMRYVAETKSG